ncbi:uncharacterized protein LOC119543674 [Choloepus didactylus]|uniref:uncharacterized protein LOC119543674 n=1 Tax=Choloepus didactylus TaxID=27675 RepID=UPI00189DFE92|nr:uncharacterized protein LOC119543674 [Choloepus didactylus]
MAERPKREQPCGRWCFTLNNPTEEEKAKIKSIDEHCKYLVVGLEHGSENHTEHLQGFVNLRKKLRLSGVEQLISERAHFERAKGDDASNKRYCSKECLFHEFGEPQFSGKRNDLHDAVQRLRETKSLTTVAKEFPTQYVRYHRGFKELLLVLPECQLNRDWKTEVMCWWGPPGCGKSRTVKDLAPEAYWKPRGKWWDGYNGQEDVILDDFYGWLAFDDLLRLLDRYPLRVETKGGTVSFLAKRVFITSNKSPAEWYSSEFCLDALYRTLTKLHWFDGNAFIDPPNFVFNHKINF